ncbi:MAG TPA: D-glycero-beta-D-manno-heptose 1,7-bisphosphate 7-phosphatase [Elusimicrobiota bacterium]|nr:D-glycero-beta-D-manno-heptose 1,7-bisphosphate 7-phosphatase [Elusimicrobiota bacterium]
MTKNKAVFLDRDGVIVTEADYLRHEKDLSLMPGAAPALVRLRRAGFKLVVVTNQSGVARGYFTLSTLARIHRALRRMLREKGARLDAIYFCPHHPEAGRRAAGRNRSSETFSASAGVRCLCRKPGTAMLEKAAKRFGIDFASSYFVGDTTTDVRTAKNAGCRSILVKTGYGGKDGAYRVKPDAIARDLAHAARLILAREKALAKGRRP